MDLINICFLSSAPNMEDTVKVAAVVVAEAAEAIAITLLLPTTASIATPDQDPVLSHPVSTAGGHTTERKMPCVTII